MALVSLEFRPYVDDSIADNQWSEVLKIVAVHDSNRIAKEGGGHPSCVRFVDNLVVWATPHQDSSPTLVIQEISEFCAKFYEVFDKAEQ